MNEDRVVEALKLISAELKAIRVTIDEWNSNYKLLMNEVAESYANRLTELSVKKKGFFRR